MFRDLEAARHNELAHFNNRLDHIRDRFKRTVRDPFLAQSPEDRRLQLVEVMGRVTGKPRFVKEFLTNQVGSDTWKLSE